MAKFLYLICFIGICLIAGSCSNTKYLPKGETLYTGAKVDIKGSHLSKKKRKTLRKNLLGLTRPRPNSKILGLRVKLYAYNIAGHPKKKKSPAAMLKKFGEPPALLSSLDLENNINILQNYVENKGYFRAKVIGDTTIKNRKGRAFYEVSTGPQYKINEVQFEKDSSDLQKAINRTERNSLLKKGDPFELEVIKAERNRIDQRIKQRGFYYFSPENIIVDADTTIGDNKVNLYVNTKDSIPREAGTIYSIDNVYIYSNYNLSTTRDDTSKKYAKYDRGYYVIDSAQFYKPKLFAQAMQFNRGDIYSRREHNQTLNRLINLGIFKFVKNRFEPTSDTSLNAYYYLTPLPKKSLTAEIGGSTKSNNLTGSEVTVGFTNRNTFRAGEILNVNVTGGFEVQYSGQFKGFNTYRIGAETKLSIPRFLIPFVTINPRGGFVPRTNILLGYDILNKQKLYTLNSFRANYGYSWKEDQRKEHTFNPISIQYVQPVKVTDLYLKNLQTDPTLRKAIDTQFILGANYNYLYNALNMRTSRNGFFFNGNLDFSGNIAGLVTSGNAKSGNPGRIFGAPFSQYVKAETDFRYYRQLSLNNTWANRIILGAGIPYGNSNELPFIKQFFIGGNNSLRAFRSRSLGPGTYRAPGIDTINFSPDQSGDLKLELNSELRFKLFSIVYGALFVDAGNIWLYNQNPYKPGSKFTNDFLSQLAVGTGLGIRFDVSILILRLDVAFPLRKPWLPANDRWVIDKIAFGDSKWRKENIIFNLAIGYPF